MATTGPSRPRLAAGRARALGMPTRGTTNPNRLRRMDAWIAATLCSLLTRTPDPLVVDLGYGATPVTVVELAARLSRLRPDVRVVGVEIDPERVAAAQPAATESLTFVHGGFDLAGLRPAIVRAANVLRQYDEPAAAEAWQVMQRHLAPGGRLVEGTCDEIGRLAAWVLVDADRPISLTLSARLANLDRPSDLAERLPKALIHHNVAGRRIHALFRDLDDAWARASTPFGPRQRWITTCEQISGGWPVLDTRTRWRLGELTVDWDAVAPG